MIPVVIVTGMNKMAFVRFGRVIPKSWKNTRNSVAGMYHGMRKTPLGSDVARVMYDNVETLPHIVATTPIPLYPTNTLTALYSIFGSKNRAAKFRTYKKIVGRGAGAINSIIDDKSMARTGFANMMAGY